MSEIERKWVLTAMPDLSQAYLTNKVFQGYVFVDDGEMRYQHRGDKYHLGIKSNGLLKREEFEVEIPQWIYKAMWANRVGNTIKKDYYQMQIDEMKYEIDVFYGRLKGLVLLEIEFPTVYSAEKYVLTEWFAENSVEVTHDPRYKNKWMAIHGLPAGTILCK